MSYVHKAPSAVKKWSLIAISGIFVGFTVYILPDQNRVNKTIRIVTYCNDKINNAVITAVTNTKASVREVVNWWYRDSSRREVSVFAQSADRISEVIRWYDKQSSATRTKVLEDNEKKRVDILKAEARGESIADHTVMLESVAQLTKIYEKLKEEQDKIAERALRAQQEKASKEMLENQPNETKWSYGEEKELSKDDSHIKYVIDSSSENEDEDEEEKTVTVARMSTLIGLGVQNSVQVFSSLLFGSSRRESIR